MPAPRLTIRLFGPMEILVDGVPIPRLRTRSGKRLLAALALRVGQNQERRRLAEQLWPDSEPDAARDNLRRALTDLRAALGPAACAIVATGKDRLRLERSAVDLDVARFDDAVARWSRQRSGDAAQAALDGCRGPLLEGDDDPELVGERLVRAERAIEIGLWLGRAALDEGDIRTALVRARDAERIDPLRDSTQQLLYEALARSGDLPALRIAFREFRLRLARDAGLDAAPETVALVHRLDREMRRGDGVGGLPAFLVPLRGRDDDVEGLVARISRPVTRLLTLTGVGGVGKTRLAIAAAQRVQERNRLDVRFVDLTGVDASAVAARIGRALSLPPERCDAYDQLGKESLLLVVDNAEGAAAAVADVAQRLLRAAPGVRVLVTSRIVLGVPGELIWPVCPLDEADAVALLAERAQTGDEPLDREGLAAICHQLDCLPLALELAAPRLRALTCSQLGERLSRSHRMLVGGDALPPRQRSLEAVLEASAALLDDEERLLLRRLSVFVGGATAEAVEAVCGAPPLTSERAIDALSGLIDKSLAVRAGERCRLLETVRAFAADRLRASGEAEAMQERHAAYFADLAAGSRTAQWTEREPEWLDAVTAEHDNVCAALRWRGGRSPEAGLTMAADLFRFWYVRGHLAEGEATLDDLLARATVPCDPQRLRGLIGIAYLRRDQGKFAEAETALEAALEGATQADVGRVQTLAHHGLGLLAADRGADGDARSHLSAAIAVWRAENDAPNLALSLATLAWVALRERDWAEAATLSAEALGIYRRASNAWGQSLALSVLGVALQRSGDRNAARRRFAESLALAQRTGSRRAAALALRGLGTLAYEDDDLDGALRLQSEALKRARAADDLIGVADSLEALADIRRDQGDATVAAMLEGWCAALRERSGGSAAPRPTLPAGLESAFAEGATLSVEAICRRALAP